MPSPPPTSQNDAHTGHLTVVSSHQTLRADLQTRTTTQVVPGPISVKIEADFWSAVANFSVIAGALIALATLILVTYQIRLTLRRPRLHPGGARTLREGYGESPWSEITLYAFNDGAAPAEQCLLEVLIPYHRLDVANVPEYGVALGDPQHTRKVGGVWYFVRTLRSTEWLFPNGVPQDFHTDVRIRGLEPATCLLRLYDPFGKVPRDKYYRFPLTSEPKMENLPITLGPADHR